MENTTVHGREMRLAIIVDTVHDNHEAKHKSEYGNYFRSK